MRGVTPVLAVFVLLAASHAQVATPLAATVTSNGSGLPHIVTLTMTEPPTQVPGVIISGNNYYRSTVSGGPYNILPMCGFSVPTLVCNDNTVLAGMTYYYVSTNVCIVCTPPESTFSPQAIAVIPPPTPPQPAAPSGLNATETAAKQTLLNWQVATETGVTRQNLYRQNQCAGIFRKQKQLPATATSYTDTTAKKGCNAYSLTATTKAGGDGPMSNVATVTIR